MRMWWLGLVLSVSLTSAQVFNWPLTKKNVRSISVPEPTRPRQWASITQGQRYRNIFGESKNGAQFVPYDMEPFKVTRQRNAVFSWAPSQNLLNGPF